MTTATTNRTEILQDWLRKHNAIHLWHGTLKVRGTMQISAYNINGVCVLIHEHSGGWEIYIPASNSINVDESLADAEKRLGISAN